MAGPVRNVGDVKTSTHREGTLVLMLTIDRLTEIPSLIKSQWYAIHISNILYSIIMLIHVVIYVGLYLLFIIDYSRWHVHI